MQSIIIRALALAALALPVPALAFQEPPVRSAQDASCRDEARARVFTAPNPHGKSLFEVGRGIYGECMARAGVRKAASAGR